MTNTNNDPTKPMMTLEEKAQFYYDVVIANGGTEYRAAQAALAYLASVRNIKEGKTA